MLFSAEERTACQQLIKLALEEDLGSRGDVTSQAVIPADMPGRAVFVARAPGVVAGLPAAALVSEAVDPQLAFAPVKSDGEMIQLGDRLAVISGSMRSILTSERTALNFMQHMSGIATLTRRFVDAVAGLSVRILDTRKTIPGWRQLAKYAVRQGGGHNHRLGLHDGILIKDNHLKGLQIADCRLLVQQALHAVKGASSAGLPVEIEVESLDQLDVALSCQPDIILLDNMPPPMLRHAVMRRNAAAPHILLEASGGVTLTNVRAIAENGVDRISIGALTHSAPALDIALDYEA